MCASLEETDPPRSHEPSAFALRAGATARISVRKHRHMKSCVLVCLTNYTRHGDLMMIRGSDTGPSSSSPPAQRLASRRTIYKDRFIMDLRRLVGFQVAGGLGGHTIEIYQVRYVGPASTLF